MQIHVQRSNVVSASTKEKHVLLNNKLNRERLTSVNSYRITAIND